jgi:hypothetical protein
VLSHSRGLLCQLWDRAKNGSRAALEICDSGADRSTLKSWGIEAAALTEFDRLHRLVREYVDDARGDPQAIAPALRLLLESFLRVAFVAHFKPGWSLATYCKHIKRALDDGSPVLSAEDIQKLDDLREYANRFHHLRWGRHS